MVRIFIPKSGLLQLSELLCKRKQLEKMIFAVFHSWNSPRAIAYREAHDISADLGVAVTIQAMVFGNYNERSGCGFAYTRNPTTGENAICGRYLSFCEVRCIYCLRIPSSHRCFTITGR